MVSGSRFRLLIPVCAFLAVSFGAATFAGQQEQRPRFISGANLRTVDFQVMGPDGLPVTDLKAEEVQVRVDGRNRPVTQIQLVDIVGAAAPGETAATLPPAFASNTGTESGRVVIIAIEDESFRVGRERPMKAALNRFLDQLSPRDRAGLVTMPHGGWKVHPTTNKEQVKEALVPIIGHADQEETADDAMCRTRTTLETLTVMLDQLGTAAVPPTVLFFSSKMSGTSGIKAIQSAAGATGVNPQVANIGRCELIPLTFNRVGHAAGRAKARFYVIQPDDEPLATQNLEGLENLAGVTGATRLAIAAGGEGTLDRVLRETTSYYLVGFAPEEADNNGMSHPVDIRVTRPGVRVISRKEAMFDKIGFGATIVTATAREMLKETKTYRDVPMRAISYVSRHTDKEVKILAAAEAIDPTQKFTSFEAALFDPNGRMVASYVGDAVTIAQSPAMAAFAVPPGRYRLRVAATNASNQGGTVDQEIDAELTPAGPFKLSSLVLGLSRNNDFVPRLQFTSEPVAITFLEIYGGQEGQKVAAWLEIAQTMDGDPFRLVPLVVEATSEPDRWKAMGAVAVGAFPPGDFVVRAVVQVEGSQPGQVTRIIRKVQ